jgi:hypothetical protein
MAASDTEALAVGNHAFTHLLTRPAFDAGAPG